MECDKHPENFRGLSPEEFAKEFGNTNYFYQEKVFEELNKEYLRQSEGDKKRGRPQLSSGLEQVATAFHLVYRAMGKVCNSCKNYLKNPYKNE